MGIRIVLTEPAWRAAAAILEALNAGETKHVAVMAHSQSTIITSNVLATIAKALEFDRVNRKVRKWHLFTHGLMGEVKTDQWEKSVGRPVTSGGA